MREFSRSDVEWINSVAITDTGRVRAFPVEVPGAGEMAVMDDFPEPPAWMFREGVLTDADGVVRVSHAFRDYFYRDNSRPALRPARSGSAVQCDPRTHRGSWASSVKPFDDRACEAVETCVDLIEPIRCDRSLPDEKALERVADVLAGALGICEHTCSVWLRPKYITCAVRLARFCSDAFGCQLTPSKQDVSFRGRQAAAAACGFAFAQQVCNRHAQAEYNRVLASGLKTSGVYEKEHVRWSAVFVAELNRQSKRAGRA